MKERKQYIDMGAGIMVLWIIFGHANSVVYFTAPDYQVNYPSFLFFAMFWFFYKSGQFFAKRTMAEEWVKDSRKLIYEFAFWSAVGYALHLFFHRLAHNLVWRDATYGIFKEFLMEGHIQLNMPLWFLLTLFLVRQVANCILPDKEDKDSWLKCVVIALIGYGIAFACYHFNLRAQSLPLYMANSASGLACFALGYGLSKYETKWWMIAPCALGYLACCIWGFPGVGMRENVCASSLVYLITLPASLCGIVTFNGLCRLCSRYLSFVTAPFEFCGKYAMIIYVSHGLVYAAVLLLFDIYGLPSLRPYTLWLILGAYALTIPFCYFFERLWDYFIRIVTSRITKNIHKTDSFISQS